MRYIAHVSLLRSIIIKTASADAGISCKEAFREGKASTSVDISQEEAFRVSEASALAAFHRVKRFAWAKHCHRQHRRTGTSIFEACYFLTRCHILPVFTLICFDKKKKVEKKTRVELLYHYLVAEGEIDR